MIVKPEIDTFQNVWELERMLEVVERLTGSTHFSILEVGSMWGGTLWHWLQIADRVVAVDDEMRRGEEWLQWADEAVVDLQLLQGKSNDPDLIEKARELGPYDFAFIDADHRYESVKADWETYGPMVVPGGVIAFHDTLHPENQSDYGVGQLWAEITAPPDRRWIHIANTGHCGIGMLWL